MRFSIDSSAEDRPRLVDLQREDSWIRRLAWLGVVEHTVYYEPDKIDITDFNLRTVDLNPFGRSLSEAILAIWTQESGGAATPSFLQTASREGPDTLRQIIDSLLGLDISPDHIR